MSSADFQVRSQRWNVTAKYNSESDLSLSSPNPKIHIPVNFGGEGGVVKKKTLPYFVVHLKVFDALRNVMENLKALKSLVNSYRRTRLGALELEILKPLWDEFSNCKVNKCIRMWYLLRLTCLICLIMDIVGLIRWVFIDTWVCHLPMHTSYNFNYIVIQWILESSADQQCRSHVWGNVVRLGQVLWFLCKSSFTPPPTCRAQS